MNEQFRSKRGRKPIGDVERRTHTVSVRLSADELALVDERRQRYRRGEWLRMCTLGRLPPTVPEVNLEAYRQLGALGSNLNQIARSLNSGDSVGVLEVRQLILDLRLCLLGVAANETEGQS